jgi:hypothetical protein
MKVIYTGGNGKYAEELKKVNTNLTFDTHNLVPQNFKF